MTLSRSECCETLARAGCCDTWPKPCRYHEGVADALAALGHDLSELVPGGQVCDLCYVRDAVIVVPDYEGFSPFCRACYDDLARSGYLKDPS